MKTLHSRKHSLLIIGLVIVSVIVAIMLADTNKQNRERNNTLPTFDASKYDYKNLPDNIPGEHNNVGSAEASTFKISIPEDPTITILYKYIEVTDGCGPYYEGECVNVRSGPGTEYPIVARLRTGVVLKVASTVQGDDREWHKIKFDAAIRYRERISGNWYVAADLVNLIENEGDKDHVVASGDIDVSTIQTKNVKRILVDRSEQKLYAYEGDVLFMEESISTGKELTPTPRGNFTVYRKTPSRYMQGPLPGISEKYYDLPGVPWNLYFTKQGGVIHGAYWHDNFGEPWSNGCVNLPPKKAEELYHWADSGTPVTIRD